MKRTQYQGVYERAQNDGKVSLVIRYKIAGKAFTEALGIKGAKLTHGETLNPKLASLLRSDRMSQVAREGDVVLTRGRIAPTLAEVFADLQDHLHGTAGLEVYGIRYHRYLEPRWGKTRLDQITESDVALAVKEWKTNPAYVTHFGGPPGTATINHVLTTLLRIFNFATDRGTYHGRIPVSGSSHSGAGTVQIKSSKRLNNTRERVFTADEVNAILDWARVESPELWLQAKLALLTGARQRELCGWDSGKNQHHGLRWMDVDFKRGEITLLRKGNTYQTLPVDAEVTSTLRSQERQDPSSRVVGPFQRYHWERCRDALGLNPTGTIQNKLATWHSFRHTYATWYLEAGGNIKDLSELMNHSDISITSRYLTSNEGNQRKSNASLAQRLRRSKVKVA